MEMEVEVEVELLPELNSTQLDLTRLNSRRTSPGHAGRNKNNSCEHRGAT